MVLHPATTNIGKFDEFVHMARAEGIDVEKLPGIDLMREPVEDAATFSGNADIKAIAYSRMAPGEIVLADDSGLEVDALGGRPGVRSARFADDLGFEMGAGCTDVRNNRAVLSLLAELHNPSRAARFVCALSLARDGEVLLRSGGSLDGQLLTAPRGARGFGYDPLFLMSSTGLTLAELTREQKWQISHRGNAYRSLLEQLRHCQIQPAMAQTA